METPFFPVMVFPLRASISVTFTPPLNPGNEPAHRAQVSSAPGGGGGGDGG